MRRGAFICADTDVRCHLLSRFDMLQQLISGAWGLDLLPVLLLLSLLLLPMPMSECNTPRSVESLRTLFCHSFMPAAKQRRKPRSATHTADTMPSRDVAGRSI